MSVVYDHEHVFWLIEKTFNITETGGILEYIAELEAENEEWIGYFDACYTDMCHYKDRAEQAEATIDLLKTALVAIQSTTPGSAHRIAIQALAERSTP